MLHDKHQAGAGLFVGYFCGAAYRLRISLSRFPQERDCPEPLPGAVAGVPLADTLKRAGAGRRIEATLDRAGLWRAQTP